jgi:hypothetical protein
MPVMAAIMRQNKQLQWYHKEPMYLLTNQTTESMSKWAGYMSDGCCLWREEGIPADTEPSTRDKMSRLSRAGIPFVCWQYETTPRLRSRELCIDSSILPLIEEMFRLASHMIWYWECDDTDDVPDEPVSVMETPVDHTVPRHCQDGPFLG